MRAIYLGTPNINTQNYTNFSSFLKFFQALMSRNLTMSLIIGYCIASNGSGVVFNILTSRNLAIF